VGGATGSSAAILIDRLSSAAPAPHEPRRLPSSNTCDLPGFQSRLRRSDEASKV